MHTAMLFMAVFLLATTDPPTSLLGCELGSLFPSKAANLAHLAHHGGL